MTTRDNRIYVLDDGFVELVKAPYTEEEILEIARVTTLKAGYKKGWNDRLLERMLEEHHTSPFDFAEVHLYVRMPIPLKEQWFRHRTGTREQVTLESTDDRTSRYHAQQQFSARYAALESGVYVPAVDWLNTQSVSNHQGRTDEVVPGAAQMREKIEAFVSKAQAFYRDLLASGLAREIARFYLPQGAYTEFHWKQSLPNLLHWLRLRRHKGAQREIREYARAVEQIVQDTYPKLYTIWDNIAGGAELTRRDCLELRRLLKGQVLSPRLYKKLIEDVEGDPSDA